MSVAKSLIVLLAVGSALPSHASLSDRSSTPKSSASKGAAALRRSFAEVALARAVQATQGEAIDLVRVPKVDEETQYTATMEGTFGDATIKTVFKISEKILEVDDEGNYTIETKMGVPTMTVNGEEIPADSEAEESTRKQKFDKRGRLIEKDPADEESDSDEEEQDPFSSSLELAVNYEPASPVKVGEKWTPEKQEDQKFDSLEFTRGDDEKLGDEDVHVITGKGKGPDDVNIETSLYLQKGNFKMKKTVVKISGIPAEEGSPGEATLTVVQNAE